MAVPTVDFSMVYVSRLMWVNPLVIHPGGSTEQSFRFDSRHLVDSQESQEVKYVLWAFRNRNWEAPNTGVRTIFP